MKCVFFSVSSLGMSVFTSIERKKTGYRLLFLILKFKNNVLFQQPSSQFILQISLWDTKLVFDGTNTKSKIKIYTCKVICHLSHSPPLYFTIKNYVLKDIIKFLKFIQIIQLNIASYSQIYWFKLSNIIFTLLTFVLLSSVF